MAEQGIVVPETGAEAPPPTNAGDRPAWLPENFKSPEDLAKSYKEAQAELTRLKQGNPPATEDKTASGSPAAPVKDLSIPDADAAKAAVDAAGLNFDAFADEFMKEGKLADTSYAALEKAGIPKAIVDTFIADRQREAESIRGEVIQIAGGDEAFQSMVQWAATSYKDAPAYNAMISSGDPAQMRVAITALKTAYVQANGNEPNLIMGNGVATGGDVYANDLEMVADMQKPEYNKDPAFRRKVQEKVARTMGVKL